MLQYKRLVAAIGFICLSLSVFATEVKIDFTKYRLIGDHIEFFIDTTNQHDEYSVLTQEFTLNTEKVLNLDMQSSPIWVKIRLSNAIADSSFLIDIENANLDLVVLYAVEGENIVELGRIGDALKFYESDRFNDNPFPVFPIQLASNGERTYLLKVLNTEPVILPIYLGTRESVIGKIQNRELFFGIYVGIMLVMFLYNLFIFISLRTKMYFLYVLYIMLIFIAQSTFLGYSHKYLFSGLAGVFHIGSFIFPAFVIMQGLYFIYEFLNVKTYTPRMKYAFLGFGMLCSISVVLALSGLMKPSFYILQPVAGLSAVFILVLCIIHIRKGSRQAKFLILAWSMFFIGVIVWVLKNLNVLEHNFITNYSMAIGSALETILLSFALADRINTLKKEREESQKQMLEEMSKNQHLTQNLNKELEKQVAERTNTLEITNEDLNKTLANLKETQSQLLESEKMASLGHLTAGIAHEINNPINFVSSNVEPLRNDLEDVLSILHRYDLFAHGSEDPTLKEILAEAKNLDIEYGVEEMKQLINGIEEGARRTSEIVTGLKNFSRTDEEDFKTSDINDGLKSTITILKSQLGSIKLNVKYGDIPKILCQLSKLNQVFMNVIDNSIDAIQERWGDSPKGVLTVLTEHKDGQIHISISDNGNGMSEEVKKNIFDPFYTTKDVGEGTGLGLSISYSIVEKHNGHIDVDSTPGEGTSFVMRIPEKYEAND